MSAVTAIQLPSVPIMEWTRFAEQVGLPRDVIRGMLCRDQLPSKKFGKRLFVNLAALTQICLSEVAE